jgi:hypothetical protein
MQVTNTGSTGAQVIRKLLSLSDAPEIALADAADLGYRRWMTCGRVGTASMSNGAEHAVYNLTDPGDSGAGCAAA